MKLKAIKIAIICGAAAIFLAAPFAVKAANNVLVTGPVNFQFNIIDPPSNQTTIIGQSGGAVTDLTVNSNNMIVTLDDASSTIRFDKTDGSTYFKVTEVTSVHDYTVSPACPDSYVIITGGSSGTVQLKIEMTTVRPSCLATHNGGAVNIYPINYSVSVNSGQGCTQSGSVTLNLAADNASDVLISNDPNFTNASWMPFTFTSLPWTLAPGDGARTVYVLFRSSTQNFAPVQSATINVNSAGCNLPPVPPVVLPPTPPVPPVLPTTCIFDCKKVTYDLYIVNPDGTERHLGTKYVRAVNNAKDVFTYYFEDKTDFNYQDAIVKIDKSDCSHIKATLISSNSAWHHQIKIKLLYGGTVKDDLTLWLDDKNATDFTYDLDLNTVSALCEQQTQLQFGDLLKGSADTIYYYASDGNRYVFPSRNTYDTWYSDFSKVKNVTDTALATIPIAKNITFRPGVKMVKLDTDPKVYAVDGKGTLRWVKNEAVAEAIYGASWRNFIEDVSDAFFINYQMGADINSASDYNLNNVLATWADLEKDLGLK